MLTLDRRELAAIFAGGALGTVVRASLGTVFATDPTRWPWPTFTVNLLGAFLLGYFTTRLLERLPLSNYRRPLLGTGLCGGLTTFSTMQVETVHMLDHHRYHPRRRLHRGQHHRGCRRRLRGHRPRAPGPAAFPVSLLTWVGVVLLGGTGAVLRFLVDRTVGVRLGRAFPFGTLTVNVTGAAILGLLSGLALNPDAALIAGTAAGGSDTTFSTWMLETHRAAEERRWPIAAANIVVSVVLGLAAALAGQTIGAHW